MCQLINHLKVSVMILGLLHFTCQYLHFYHASSHSTVLLQPHGHLKAFLFHFNPSKFQSFREFFLFFIYGELEMDVYATDTNGWCELGAS